MLTKYKKMAWYTGRLMDYFNNTIYELEEIYKSPTCPQIGKEWAKTALKEVDKIITEMEKHKSENLYSPSRLQSKKLDNIYREACAWTGRRIKALEIVNGRAKIVLICPQFHGI